MGRTGTRIFLAFLSALACSLQVHAQVRDLKQCSNDPEFGRYCPTMCGVADVLSKYAKGVDEDSSFIDSVLTQLAAKHGIVEGNVNIVNEDVRITRDEAQIIKDSGQKTVQQILEEVRILEQIGVSHDAQIQELSEMWRVNQQLVTRLQQQLVDIRQTCSRSCQDTTANKISPITGKDCQQVVDNGGKDSGLYYIKPLKAKQPFLVFCEIENGNGWTVIQHRHDGSVNFTRDWVSYREGFGYLAPTLTTEFWLGNEKIHLLTGQQAYRLRIDLTDWENTYRYADYGHFKLTPESDEYRLFYSMYLDGDAGNAFDGFDFGDDPQDKFYTTHLGMLFSTPERDNDKYEGSCAEQDGSGWWMNRCHAGHLNGKYYYGGKYRKADVEYPYDDGIIWATWHDRWYSLKMTTMKLLPMGRDLSGHGGQQQSKGNSRGDN
ncbi:fibrinogen gamma chain [Lethenteron reissneri]|uniref:fibrinogen gamma chain n=1 Tax=Lethenteron reissneri TaxID=7753 RepID=UPI002AB61560|nr:fibrinogen gamma chain [Lethenteron reissneri]